MRRLKFLILLLLISFSSIAQHTVKGKVIDIRTGEGLAKANIFLNELNIGTATDKEGDFLFKNIPEGEFSISIKYIGYKPSMVRLDTRKPYDELQIKLTKGIYEINPITVTASQNTVKEFDVPGRMAIIGSEEIKDYPSANSDDILRSVSGVYVNRSWGIFSKNTSVTMRGLNSSARSLILLDGVPLNKMAGGSINWNLIQADQIEKIEVVKGPNSSIYGNNAMGGVINIFSYRPKKSFELGIKGSFASYNTSGGQLNLGTNKVKNGKGFYGNIILFGRSGDGYVLEKEETRDSTDVEAYLTEYNTHELAGYRFNQNHSLELEHFYYYGKHGNGGQVYETDGGYDLFSTHVFIMKYKGILRNGELNARVFYQNEYYKKQSESVSSNSGKYKLSETFSRKNDEGIWLSYSFSVPVFNNITIGTDLKEGDVDADEIYRTSTDHINYYGNLGFYGVFIQDEVNLFKEYLVLTGGLRFDYARFFNGHLSVINPTSATGFTEDIHDSFTDNNWTQISPKLTLHSKLSNNLNAYLSYGTGFMPPKLDDLCKSGKISKGFKIANPKLTPETLSNYELGVTWTVFDKVIVKPSIYYSLGKNFLYLVGTGDSLDTGGTDLKPVYQRQNISKVGITGAEISVSYTILPNVLFSANYSYNQPEILKYSASGGTNADLKGKTLNEVPEHQAFASVSWKNKILNAYMTYNYIGEQWFDDANTMLLDRYQLLDIKVYRNFLKQFTASLTVQNLLDKEFIDRKGYLNPGRFILFEIKWNL